MKLIYLCGKSEKKFRLKFFLDFIAGFALVLVFFEKENLFLTGNV